MKATSLTWLTLLSCISLFGLVSYRLINAKLTDEEKKKISYSEIVISLFASFNILFSMIMLMMGLYAHGLLSLSEFTNNPYYFNNLKAFIWAIFCIITSPISLTTIQYAFQDNLGNSDKFLSIVILISTIFSSLIPLSIISSSFFRKTRKILM